eukprot:scaffold111316_cov48-Phaeocystis_antarctica.AAC.1
MRDICQPPCLPVPKWDLVVILREARGAVWRPLGLLSGPGCALRSSRRAVGPHRPAAAPAVPTARARRAAARARSPAW